MTGNVRERLSEALKTAVRDHFGVELDPIVAERPPTSSLGDLAFPAAFELARKAKKPPRGIAETLGPELQKVEGVARVDVAGAGYINVFFDRRSYLERFLAEPDPAPRPGKVIVEHTNINPNKAAHIGHLRNAALGDSFVRVLRYRGREVEVQNYIDDTGVQVADVVVGFHHLENKSLEEVQGIAADSRFDYVCWDLYARVSEFFQEDPERRRLREATLKAIEEGEPPEAPLAAFVAEKIVRCHLATMERVDARYDLLPWESDILKLRFWDRAYELLKEKGAIRLATAGKNEGCWVMDLADETSPEEGAEKVIVRSNGTVTYVGKDIAYQMWKLGLLDRKFGYRRFHHYPDGTTLWSTTSESAAEAGAPDFGAGERVYNVIDVRQAYLQNIVQRGVALLASTDARDRSHHFSYEMVALTPATCRELGFEVSSDDEKRPYLEVSGRKGLGVKADELIEALEDKARPEVEKRNQDLAPEALEEIVRTLARGALRYFMIKYTKNKVIAFDFAEALSFEGDSGPYLQYAAVRAARILEKLGASPEETRAGRIEVPSDLEESFQRLDPEEADEIWSLAFGAMELVEVAATVVRTEEPAHLARFALAQAQRFNGFYHKHPILKETDEAKRKLRLLAVQMFYRQHALALELVGIPVPERM